MRNLFCVYKDLSYCAQLVLGLLRCNLINSKATLDVIDQREILFGLVNADDVHKTTRAGYIRSDLAINLGERLHADLFTPLSIRAASSLLLKMRCGENIVSAGGDQLMDEKQTHPSVYPASSVLVSPRASHASWDHEP